MIHGCPKVCRLALVIPALLLAGCHTKPSTEACEQMVLKGLRPIASLRDERFQGKVEEATAACRGELKAIWSMNTPCVDWANYWGAGDATSKAPKSVGLLGPDTRGVDEALLDLEYQRIELIKFNLFDNNGTYEQYVTGRDSVGGPALKVWPAMRLKPTHPNYKDVGGDGQQVCKRDFARARTVDGI